MVAFVVRQFRGIAPRANPRSLQDNQAQVAINCKLWHGSLRPLKSNLSVAATLGKAADGTIKKIYRFGHNTMSDTLYWFQFLDDTDICRGQTLGDTTERTYFTDGIQAKVTDNTMALSGGTANKYPMVSKNLGVPAPTNLLVATVTGTGTGDIETRSYVYTYVTAWGEESKPYNATIPGEVGVQAGQTVTLSGMGIAGPGGSYNTVTHKRVYRSTTGQWGGAFMLVSQVSITVDGFVDNVATEDLGEEIPSTNWSMPPASLNGLVSLPNGMMAGFYGKDVYLCEPYKPYAWPLEYVIPVDFNVVALGVTDTTLVILTTGFPYLAQGSSPDTMTAVKASVAQSCVSKRSVAFLAGSIIYASPDGLFAINSNGPPVNLTEDIFTNTEWRDTFTPATIHGYVFDDKYVGFYNGGMGAGGFIVDPKRGDFTMLDWYATAGHYDPQRDALFLVVSGLLYKFDAASYPNMTATWWTKDFYSPRPISLGAIRVEAANYPVTVHVYADGTNIGTFSVTSKSPQRLPAGFKANVWSAKIITAVEVYSVGIAEEMEDFRNV